MENLYSFVHLINDVPRLPHTTIPCEPEIVDVFAQGIVPQARPPDIEPPSYSDFLRSDHTHHSDSQLQLVRDFLNDLK